MYTTLSGQISVAKQIDLIANNIANVNTTGFKAERPIFEVLLNDKSALLTSTLKKDVREPNPFSSEQFGRMKESYSDFSSGAFETTGNPLDVAIQGKGFFVITTPNGERYTRAGNFKLDSAGRLSTQDGYLVQGQGGDITLTPGQVSVAGDGEVKVNGKAVAKLRIVDLDTSKATREPGQIFNANGGAASDLDKAEVAGGTLEASNVNAVRELADMILASRLFEGMKNAQETASRIDQARNEKLGSVQG